MSEFNFNEITGNEDSQELDTMIQSMTNEDLKVILSAARPNGLDRDDPLISRAIARADADPSLRDWFRASQAWDAGVAGALAEVRAPAGLRERIISTTMAQWEAEAASKSAVTSIDSGRNTPWFAMAAAAVLLVGGTFFVTELLNNKETGETVKIPDQPINETPVTPLTPNAEAVLATWQSDAVHSVEGILAGKVNSAPLPPADRAWGWLGENVPAATDDPTSTTPGESVGGNIAGGEAVACLAVEKPDVGEYALFCFKAKGTLSHLAVFDGVRDLPQANENGIEVVQQDNWQTVSWVEEGRTLMLFFFTDDVQDPKKWASELMKVDIAAL